MSEQTSALSASKRGRLPNPCPSHEKLRRLAAEDLRPVVLARKMGAHPNAIIRWLGEIGIEYKVKPGRKRGVVPAYLMCATVAGRRKHTRLYGVWSHIKSRCYNSRDKDFSYYGGKGVRVAAEWREDFAPFRAWAIANGYRKGLTLDRIDGNGDYGPNNCRWATRTEQTYNSKSVYKFTLNGVTKILPEWARELGLPMNTLRVRKRKGWPDHYALTIPLGGHCPGIPLKPRGRKAALSTGETK